MTIAIVIALAVMCGAATYAAIVWALDYRHDTDAVEDRIWINALTETHWTTPLPPYREVIHAKQQTYQ